MILNQFQGAMAPVYIGIGRASEEVYFSGLFRNNV